MIEILYTMLCVFIPCIEYQVIELRTNQNMERNISTRHFIGAFIFILYIGLALDVAGIGTVWDIVSYDTLFRVEEINIIPFQSEGLLTYILNIIMFMPLGFLLPLIWKNYRKFTTTFITGVGFSLVIELSQLFNRRQTDIDDLLMNTIGTIIGFTIWIVYKKIFKINKQDKYSLGSNEAVIYIVLSVLSTFFLYNWRFISGW